MSVRGSVLLDTNTVIDLLEDRAIAKDQLAQTDEVFIASIVLGELYFGAEKSGRPQANRARINDFVVDNVVLNCDTDTAQRYGVVKNALRRKGRPIPENDIWIAAVALQYDLTLITRDEHFNEVEGLKMAAW
jgi:tRNA(fMet)-specific endonuclease VapC